MSETSKRRKALSATSTKTWLQCPMKFRLTQVDGFKEPPSPATTRGTLVHAVLEDLFDLPAEQRTAETASEMIGPLYEKTMAQDEQFLSLFEDDVLLDKWKEEVRALVRQYFAMENPTRLEPYARERFVRVKITDQIAIHGFIDRIDKAPNGAIRVVDYKTGKSPQKRFEEDMLFQMRFYSLLLRNTDLGLPARTQLVFLGDGRTLTLDPTPESIEAFEHQLVSIWQDIETAAHRKLFPPKKQVLCNWCGVQNLCPLYSSNPPEISQEGLERLLEIKG
ncbi:RecB family exonuclease [Gleimia europaea]|uniref:RecB family exonuclease n=1 Tax=Gleimia europaea TaxID=66228 RepID=UPI000C80267F|nr:PD-(D/E)XK nuclease family protein [Gleimia europaea]MDK7143870.1 PD-(D/E)XK nuclease family protein [Gleimia europaea]MDK8533684.1 PD-(D/E)XK nuclease family protein [Gleimia europaea]WIK61865.1 PD-(D/E)XK nuclease family protein [Gleimia europaea]